MSSTSSNKTDNAFPQQLRKLAQAVREQEDVPDERHKTASVHTARALVGLERLQALLDTSSTE